MSISFNDIPSALRVPWTYIEFDNTGAVTGLSQKTFKSLVIGQRLSTGTKAAGTITRVTSADQAATYFGLGSLLHQMAKAYFQNNAFTETYFAALDDDGSGVQATGKISIVASSAGAGVIYLYIAGVQIKVAVTANQTAAQIATAMAAAINAVTALPVTAAVNGTNAYEVDLTCRWDGETGNEIDIRANYNAGESLPSGVTLTITAMASGAANPDISGIITAMADQQYDVIVNPYKDATNLAAIQTELAARFGPQEQKEGFAFMAKDETVANLSTFGESKNTQFFTTLGIYKSPTPGYQIAAALGAVVAYYAAIDPARPFQTLELKSVLAPAESDRFTLAEANSLLYDGISTPYVDANGGVRIQRLITMYRLNASGAADVSYLDVTTMYTLAYIRYDFRNMMLTKYPRHKLANDGTRFGPGQAIITPAMAKAEALAKYRQWEEAGLVENVDAFKAGLIVERNASDANRLDFELTPDVMNSFVVAGVKIKFLL